MSEKPPFQTGESEKQLHAFAEEIRAYQHRFAQAGDGQPHRGFHVKSHAGLKGRFEVTRDVPDKARHGVFREPRTFDAWVRFSNGFSAARPDWAPDMLGLSVKLLGVEGLKLLPGASAAGAQDFIALNLPSLPVSTAGQLFLLSTASANLASAPFRIVSAFGWAHAAEVLRWALGWSWRRLWLRSVTTEDYHGVAPISIGPAPVKFSWRSRQETAPLPAGASLSNFLRDDLRARLSRGDLKFDLMAQFWVDEVMTPIEGAAAWDVGCAPPVKLAELTIPACDLDTPQARRDERYVDALSFNPWHAIAEHRPLGAIQRARAVVYSASSAYWGRDDDPAAS